MPKNRRYTKEEKTKIIQRTLPPESIRISDLSRETQISATSLYKWRKEILQNLPTKSSRNKVLKDWSSKDKFHVVLETSALNEIDLAAYCRTKGLYPEQVKEWYAQCLEANASHPKDATKLEAELREEKIHSRELQKELARKEKALAETAALLVLRKKAQAIWGDQEEE